MTWRFRFDVRLVRSSRRGVLGFQRGRHVVWLPDAIAQHIWRNPDDASTLPLFAVLHNVGLLEPDETCGTTGDGAQDRNRIFATAICDECADTAIKALPEIMFVIVGCGGLGSSIATMLASLGARHFVLIDGDTIEKSNLNRLLWAEASQVGEPKAQALAAHLESRFEASAVVRNAFLKPSDLPAIAALYARAFAILSVDDNVIARGAIRSLHKSMAMPYVHVGYVGSLCSVGPLVTRPADPCPFCGAAALEFVDVARFVAPSAAPNNLLIAGVVTSQLLRWAGNLTTMVHGHRWVLDLVGGGASAYPLGKDSKCAVCS